MVAGVPPQTSSQHPDEALHSQPQLDSVLPARRYFCHPQCNPGLPVYSGETCQNMLLQLQEKKERLNIKKLDPDE